jgi:iron complex transport system ATP-binding protein
VNLLLLRARNISFAYGSHRVLNRVSLTLNEGEIVALLGANGGGKSTLLRVLAGLEKPQHGADIQILGQPLSAMGRKAVARRIAVLGQELPRAFGFTVAELASLGRFPYLAPWQRMSTDDRRAVEKALTATELLELRTRPLETLSGGERQRVGLAIALAQEPSILLLDEPTAYLDLKHKSTLFSVLRQAQQERKMGTLLVTHDLGLAAEHASRVILLSKGDIIACGNPQEVLTREALERVFETSIELIVNPQTGIPHAFAGGGLVLRDSNS